MRLVLWEFFASVIDGTGTEAYFALRFIALSANGDYLLYGVSVQKDFHLCLHRRNQVPLPSKLQLRFC